MNYLKETEELLNKYKTMPDTLKNLTNRKNKLLVLTKPKEVTAVDYSNIPTQKMAYSKDTMNQLLEIIDVQEKISQIEMRYTTMTDVFEQIKKKDKLINNFIQYRYINGLTLEKCAKELGYSENSKESIYNIKDKAINLFAILYFGI